MSSFPSLLVILLSLSFLSLFLLINFSCYCSFFGFLKSYLVSFDCIMDIENITLLSISLFLSFKESGLESGISKMAEQEVLAFLTHRNTNLIMTYETKYLYENSRSQVSSYSTPGKHKTDNSHIAMDSRAISLYLHQPLPTTGTAQYQERLHQSSISFLGERESGVCIQCPSLSLHCLRDGFLSHLTHNIDKTGIFLMSGGC